MRENPNVDLRKKMKTMQKSFSPQFRVTVQKRGRKTFYVQFTCYINGKRFVSAQDWHDSAHSTLEEFKWKKNAISEKGKTDITILPLGSKVEISQLIAQIPVIFDSDMQGTIKIDTTSTGSKTDRRPRLHLEYPISRPEEIVELALDLFPDLVDENQMLLPDKIVRAEVKHLNVKNALDIITDSKSNYDDSVPHMLNMDSMQSFMSITKTYDHTRLSSQNSLTKRTPRAADINFWNSRGSTFADETPLPIVIGSNAMIPVETPIPQTIVSKQPLLIEMVSPEQDDGIDHQESGLVFVNNSEKVHSPTDSESITTYDMLPPCFMATSTEEIPDSVFTPPLENLVEKEKKVDPTRGL